MFVLPASGYLTKAGRLRDVIRVMIRKLFVRKCQKVVLNNFKCYFIMQLHNDISFDVSISILSVSASGYNVLCANIHAFVQI